MSTLVILNFNGKDYLHKCLESVPHLPGMDKVLVDNASTDGSWQIADKYGFKVVHANNRHQFITGINKAISLAKPGTFIFSQGDVVFKALALVDLEMASQKNPDAFIQPVFLKPPPLEHAVDNAGMKWIWPGYGIGVTSSKKETYPTDIVTSICFATQKSNLDKLGIYGECFAPAYYEDVDMALRAKRLGIRQLVCGRAYVTHRHNESFKKLYDKLAISDICRRNRLKTIERNYTGVDRLIRKSAIKVIDSITRAVQCGYSGRNGANNI